MTDQPTTAEDVLKRHIAIDGLTPNYCDNCSEEEGEFGHYVPWPCDAYRLAVQIKAVRALHGRGRLDHMGYDGVMRYRCKGCGRTWTNESPCPTIRALEE